MASGAPALRADARAYASTGSSRDRLDKLIVGFDPELLIERADGSLRHRLIGELGSRPGHRPRVSPQHTLFVSRQGVGEARRGGCFGWVWLRSRNDDCGAGLLTWSR